MASVAGGTTTAGDRLASIIIPCCNQLAYTRRCVEALLRFSRPPWELIVVDNGSIDGTGAYLAGLAADLPVRVEVIANPTNLGFPAACNQGLRAARGEYLVLLNNDAVVTEGWLRRLIRLTEVGPCAGLVGPMSNYATPPQLVPEVPYRDLDEMHAFAADWKERHRGRWFAAPKLSGFCLLMTRGAYEELGGLDERFGLGFFDDDDLAIRAQRAGIGIVVAEDQFVHHDGSRTFAGLGIDADALLRANQAKFEAKWGAGTVAAEGATLTPFAPASPRRLRVVLTIIARDEERNLPACLASTGGLFDEVVVVDTGSRDRTREVARDLGARVVEFPWVDDFAAARNAALEHARADYAFWLDADDRIEPDDLGRFRAMLDGLSGRDLAYAVDTIIRPAVPGVTEQVIDHVRLFPLRPDLRWELPVHETVLRSCIRAGVSIRYLPLRIRHEGYLEPAALPAKYARNARLLERALAERPDDPLVRLNAGFHAAQGGDWAAALGFLRGALEAGAGEDRPLRWVYARLADDLWTQLVARFSPDFARLARPSAG